MNGWTYVFMHECSCKYQLDNNFKINTQTFKWKTGGNMRNIKKIFAVALALSVLLVGCKSNNKTASDMTEKKYKH